MTWLLVLIFIFGCAGPQPIPEGSVVVRVALDADGKQVEEIPVERYLLGVLEKEVPADWPIEALKAQAVASRTYALYRKEHPRSERFDITSDTSDQVFQRRRHYAESYLEAVRETAGQTLQFEGKVFSSFFHSCCGGITERANWVWEGSEPSRNDQTPLFPHQHDPYCEACPRYHWDYSLTRDELAEILSRANYSTSEPWTLEIVARDPSGRVATLLLRTPEENHSIPGTEFRQFVGNLNIRSTLFEIEADGDSVIFHGKGAGHGVGLCQWGAKGMADQGFSYDEILRFYYRGAEITGLRIDPPETLPESLPIDLE